MDESGRRGRPTEAAVLVPVYRDGGGRPRVILVRRSAIGAHGGQLAFPGGKREAGDEDELATALREAEEEIGLSADRVDVLAELAVVETLTTGYRVAPFLARIRPPRRWRPQPDEVAEVLDVDLRGLALPAARSSRRMEFAGWPEPREVPYIQLGPHRLWGLSLRILEPLLAPLLAGRWTL